ncbi:hypothetical protein [Ralstonia flaminis]|uniref:hypothetical protein n=1 Tax=Ralstonia flaminis TaxID=3058597 RepID=UPI00292D8DC7|nr:hypothetical protein [Ralstonia sp. LMG 18101]
MKVTEIIKIAFLMILASNALPVLAQSIPIFDESLCAENEDVYFSCGLEGVRGIVSVCAKSNDSSNEGYVQYIFGTKRKIEIEYPKEGISPQQSNISIVDF